MLHWTDWGAESMTGLIDRPDARRIRSYALRTGRMTESQLRALEILWPVYGMQVSGGKRALETSLRASSRRVLEIGFGMGDSLHSMALADPEADFIGVEVHKPGVGRLLYLAEQSGATNLRLYCADAIEVLEHCIEDASLDRLQLFFPDPWHKNKHRKRRIVQASFVNLIARKLKLGGVFHAATDWQDYATQMLKVLSSADQYENMAGSGNFSPRPDYRPTTKFEQRGCRLGHGVWDLLFRRCQGGISADESRNCLTNKSQ